MNREVLEGSLGTGDQGSGNCPWDESALTPASMECGEGATSLGVCVWGVGVAGCGAAGLNFSKTPEALSPGGGDARGPHGGRSDNRLGGGRVLEEDRARRLAK